MSLLSSRDEVFKEIQEVGEDNLVSSLHLFFGNMEILPSSDYNSLEELWDEEEEPEEVETVMKAVPAVYHQDLDVFSKLKAKKLPPHCGCDHHIKLEGSLPPVVVIYSLSNQESDTLRASISENVEKDFICQSSSSTGSPVNFVKKKDGGLHFCVDYTKINAVPRNNKYSVPPMKQLLTVFNVSSIFSKIYLNVLINHSSTQYFMSSKVLTPRQARWAEFLSEIHFSITYHPGCLATLPDALSHWDDFYLEWGEDFISKNSMSFQKLIKQDEVQPSRLFAVKVECFSNLIE
ncbi:hypothetical protein O181_010584 [Austropuccinia psidii MF-1]|uniref:Uncharacterized protein n=1 Tax=Austropuccinia psidii MF-1 TaxID=1389203 RepID=A0A9Q3BSX4_9BASI|nr:hypothetical protein [Austropuccinia psidii MF-1]